MPYINSLSCKLCLKSACDTYFLFLHCLHNGHFRALSLLIWRTANFNLTICFTLPMEKLIYLHIFNSFARQSLNLIWTIKYKRPLQHKKALLGVFKLKLNHSSLRQPAQKCRNFPDMTHAFIFTSLWILFTTVVMCLEHNYKTLQLFIW